MPEEYMTKNEVLNMHRSNMTKIADLEGSITELKSDTTEILEWIRNARLASKVVSRVFSFLGKIIRWSLKMLGIAAAFYATYIALKSGKLPTF
jgi:hypothetical protein